MRLHTCNTGEAQNHTDTMRCAVVQEKYIAARPHVSAWRSMRHKQQIQRAALRTLTTEATSSAATAIDGWGNVDSSRSHTPNRQRSFTRSVSNAFSAFAGAAASTDECCTCFSRAKLSFRFFSIHFPCFFAVSRSPSENSRRK